MIQENKNLTVNRLPVRTWNRLKVNESTITLPETLPVVEPEVTADQLRITGSLSPELCSLTGGLGEDTEVFFSRLSGKGVSLLAEKDFQEEEPTVLTFSLSEEPGISLVGVKAEENTTLTVIMDYQNGENCPGTEKTALLTKTALILEKGAKVTLIQVLAQDQGSVYQDVAARLSDGAELTVKHVVLSGTDNHIGLLAELSGRESAVSADIGYTLYGSDKLDMNYVVRHRGVASQSRIHAKGVLKEQSEKTFRGTIDFIRGSKGAVGEEQEDTLLIDEGVRNKTVPLILCEEEDVVGTHGATLGSLDDDSLFYLMSRGMTKDQVYDLLARGRMSTVISGIPHKGIRDRLLEKLSGTKEEDE